MGVKPHVPLRMRTWGLTKEKNGQLIDALCQFKYFFKHLLPKKRPLIATSW